MKNFEDILREKLKDYEVPYEASYFKEFLKYKKKKEKRKNTLKYSTFIFLASTILFTLFYTYYNQNQKEASQKLNFQNNSNNNFKQLSLDSITKNKTNLTNLNNTKDYNTKKTIIKEKKQKLIKESNQEDKNSFKTSFFDKKIITQNVIEVKNDTINTRNLKIHISENKICVPTEVKIYTNQLCNNCSYVWEINNKTYATNDNLLSILIKEPGKYEIKLKVIDKLKTIGTSDTVFFAYTKPIANFKYEIKDNSIKLINITKNITNCTFIFDEIKKENFEVEFSISKSKEYTIKQIVKTAEGCLDSISKDIYLEYKLPIYIPNAFSPNGDNINDEFFPIVFDSLNNYFFVMKIFDKFGKLIFEQEGYNVKWKGEDINSGNIAKPDIYKYVIFVKDNKGNINEIKGKVKLLK